MKEVRSVFCPACGGSLCMVRSEDEWETPYSVLNREQVCHCGARVRFSLAMDKKETAINVLAERDHNGNDER